MTRNSSDTMAEIVSVACRRIAQATGIRTVVLSGGVFLNALLTCEVVARLGHDRLQVYRHHLVPPNDGGLSLGQVAIAAAIINL
jgi:hydrogenase maturation protein HypF